METAVSACIVLDDRGVAHIEGTTAKVVEVVLNKEWANQTPVELQRDMPHLTLAQIDAALAYYTEHKEDLDAYIARSFEFSEKLRLEAGESPYARRMRVAGKLL